MRQCIFVVASRAQLLELAPLLQSAKSAGLRHSVWITGDGPEAIDALTVGTGVTASVVLPKAPAPSSRLAKALLWFPLTAYRCYNYVHGVRLWTGKSPLILIHGDGLSTRLASVGGRWGGGQLVHLQHTERSVPPRHATMRKTRFAFCGEDVASERSARYPGCKVVGVEQGDPAGLRLIIDSLLRWTGGKREND